MWRAVFSLAHSEGILTIKETDFLSKCLEEDNFSAGQKQILLRDLMEPQNLTRMFTSVSREEDKLDFFIYAEELGAGDDSYYGKEKKAMNSLKKEEYLGFPPSYLQDKLMERKIMRGS